MNLIIEKNKKYSPIFAQPYFPECDPVQMVGTEKFPCYLVGHLYSISEAGYIALYTQDGKSRGTSIWDTSLIDKYYKQTRCNLLIGGIYHINIELPHLTTGVILRPTDEKGIPSRIYKTAQEWEWAISPRWTA